MRSLSLLLLVAAAAFAVDETITDNGYAIPEYDPLPSDGEPVETPENTDWAPTDREMDGSDDVDINDVDGGRPEDTWTHHGHHGHLGHHGLHGHHGHFHHGGFRNGHFGHHFGRFHHGRRCHRHFRPTVVVTDRHHVVAHPKKPCTKVVKHVTVHRRPCPHHHHHSSSSSSEEPTCGCHAHRHPVHHHSSSSSSSEEQPTCGCRAHRGGHHHHHGYPVHGHHHGHHGHHGHGVLPIAPFL